MQKSSHCFLACVYVFSISLITLLLCSKTHIQEYLKENVDKTYKSTYYATK